MFGNVLRILQDAKTLGVCNTDTRPAKDGTAQTKNRLQAPRPRSSYNSKKTQSYSKRASKMQCKVELLKERLIATVEHLCNCRCITQ